MNYVVPLITISVRNLKSKQFAFTTQSRNEPPMKNLAYLIAFVFFACGAHYLPAEAPNFILIYADDLGYADTSVQMMEDDPTTKHSFIRTPGLDRLATLGTRYSTAYAPTPTCTASRLSIQFGKTPARLQCRNVFDVLTAVQRPNGYDDEVTLAEMLKASGKNYTTAMFGKGCSTMGRFDEAGYDVTDRSLPIISKVTRPIPIWPIGHIVTGFCGLDTFVMPLAKMCSLIIGVRFLQCLWNRYFAHVLFLRLNRRQYGIAKPAGCHSMQKAVS